MNVINNCSICNRLYEYAFDSIWIKFSPLVDGIIEQVVGFVYVLDQLHRLAIRQVVAEDYRSCVLLHLLQLLIFFELLLVDDYVLYFLQLSFLLLGLMLFIFVRQRHQVLREYSCAIWRYRRFLGGRCKLVGRLSQILRINVGLLPRLSVLVILHCHIGYF